jgi:hypothetical protein
MNLDLTPLGQAGEWLAGTKLLSPFFEKALGAIGSEVGTLVSDPIAEWRKRLAERRAQRLVRIGSSAAKQIEANGGETEHIPDYIALPLIEKATLVDDEGLQEMWASLLANAANPKTASTISHLFPTMLAALSPRQAKFLDVIFEYTLRTTSIKIPPITASAISGWSRMDDQRLMNAVANSNFKWQGNAEKNAALDNLVNQGILRRDHEIPQEHYPRLVNKLFEVAGLKKPLNFSGDQIARVEDFYQLTVAGAQFVISCRRYDPRFFENR